MAGIQEAVQASPVHLEALGAPYHIGAVALRVADLAGLTAFYRDAIGLQPDPRGHGAAAGAEVKLRGEDGHPHAALAVVVRGLQQGGGLPRIHRGVVEIELGHARILPAHKAGDCVCRARE